MSSLVPFQTNWKFAAGSPKPAAGAARHSYIVNREADTGESIVVHQVRRRQVWLRKS
jgi:hypothetical protein